MENKSENLLQEPELSRRTALKVLATAGAVLALPGVRAKENKTDCQYNYNNSINYQGLHQAGVVTPEQKNASFIAFSVTSKTIDELQTIFALLTERIAWLTQPHQAQSSGNDKLPPAESGILGTYLQPDLLTVTVALGDSLFDNRFGLEKIKPVHLCKMTPFSNDRLEQQWCGGDILLQICANSQESVIYALRDILRHLSPYCFPLWKIDGFLPSRDIDNHTTPINLFGFKDGTGNAPADDISLMNELIWINSDHKERGWCEGGTYQAVRLIRFNLEFWDRTPLEDQENDFGRYKDTGAPVGMKNEHDDPAFDKDPHGDRILFDSHMRRAEPRNPVRHTAKLRRRSYSYSLGLTDAGGLDMGLIFVSYQRNLKTGFIDTQNRLNGEPLERYIKPFGGGYYFVLPGVRDSNEVLAEKMFTALRQDN
ncbi:deferrochelatase/peroxidase EfeB [Salmonella enterica]|uniref:iron uptake transporter deferrochelatase/peroxidase subunit n=1 Tax=Salmonella enterica TaxID=28901 RepID=UPI0012D4D4AF|nr:deferrochelatase/peroxidase EfeB [Salmonella enterica]EBQ9004810.1 deferrochelatase/peroxidase EfeB [Salmonella enterica subsp. enterica serovar Blockley]ECD6161885.1 deferrochelatase/peroxidase EfeB [Salmonella enterica subsp. enterica]ECU7994980.1 deferrochelatase/peroxidase EfeB [Salmonella enterica subsp. enterica serovar Toucra]EAW3045851.1 deferrochelatase/peroxidase EfeB [Salmonella enterica]